MNEVSAKAIGLLAEAIATDERILAYQAAEEVLASSEEVAFLSKKMNEAKEAFEEAERLYGENSAQAKQSRAALYEAKLALDLHPVTKQYQAAWLKANEVLSQIEEIVFGEARRKPRLWRQA